MAIGNIVTVIVMLLIPSIQTFIWEKRKKNYIKNHGKIKKNKNIFKTILNIKKL